MGGYGPAPTRRRRAGTAKLKNLRRIPFPQVDLQALNGAQRGADYVSIRRVSELLRASTLKTFAGLSALLAAERPDQYEPSLYRVARHVIDG